MNLNAIQQLNKKNQYWLFITILVLLTFFMMFCNGLSEYYSGFDFFFHHRRLDILIEAMREGNYPFYFDYSNIEGYGYFFNGFYPDLILVPFAFIGLFTDTYFAYDCMIFFMTVLCGVLMRHTIRVVYNDRFVATIGAILYTFSMYRIYDIYDRSALAEALSFTFLPLVFLGLYYIIHGDYKKWYVLALGYSLLIYTHTITSVLMFINLLIFLIIYYKLLVKEPKRFYYLLLAGVVTLVAVAYYLLPLLEQLQHSSYHFNERLPGGGAGYGKVGFDYVFWGFLSGIAYYKTKLWTGVGIILTSVVLLRLFIRGSRNEKLKLADIGVILGVFFIFASSRIFPWGRFPFNILAFIQYPWRLYEFASFYFAIAGTYYISLLLVKKKQRVYVSLFLVAATMVTIYIHSQNFRELYPKRDKSDIIRTEKATFENNYNTIGGEYFPANTPYAQFVYQRKLKIEAADSSTVVSNLRREGNKTIANISVNRPDSIILPLLYYHGYSVSIDGQKLDAGESRKGLVAVKVDKSGEIVAWYGGTNIQKISYFVSMAAIILLVIFAYYRERKRRKGNNGDIKQQNTGG